MKHLQWMNIKELYGIKDGQINAARPKRSENMQDEIDELVTVIRKWITEINIRPNEEELMLKCEDVFLIRPFI